MGKDPGPVAPQGAKDDSGRADRGQAMAVAEGVSLREPPRPKRREARSQGVSPWSASSLSYQRPG